MRYALLAYADEQQLEALTSSERETLGKACVANDEALRTNGYLLAVAGLQHSRAATTVWLQNGRLDVTVGPLCASRQQLITIFTINARDLNEAIQIAAKMPQARSGPIEVRPIVTFD